MLTIPNHRSLKFYWLMIRGMPNFPCTYLTTSLVLSFLGNSSSAHPLQLQSLNADTGCFTLCNLSRQSHLPLSSVQLPPESWHLPNLILQHWHRLVYITVLWTSLLRWSTGSKTELTLYAKSSTWSQYGIYIHPGPLVKFWKTFPGSSLSQPYPVSNSINFTS